jgi:hypothetical protein
VVPELGGTTTVVALCGGGLLLTQPESMAPKINNPDTTFIFISCGQSNLAIPRIDCRLLQSYRISSLGPFKMWVLRIRMSSAVLQHPIATRAFACSSSWDGASQESIGASSSPALRDEHSAAKLCAVAYRP